MLTFQVDVIHDEGGQDSQLWRSRSAAVWG